MNDTIAAIATPLGRGAIGVVRMSGPQALKALAKVWKKGGQPVEKFVTHRLYLGKILDLSTGKPVDQVLASLMKNPNSYTGEDVIEISCHGGAQVLQQILVQLLEAGARPAEPGEFTKRAFLNGKMDLTQAEAVAELIDSKSNISARLAEEQLDGKLSTIIVDLGERLKKLLAFVEATIDFPEEDTEFIRDSDVGRGLVSISDDLDRLIKSYNQGRVYREGVKTVIAGPPNAGKSSLLNALLGIERAIVHHSPGTTRDTIEEGIVLGGVSFRLIDTAGIREAEAEVEEIGVEKSRRELTSAEVVLLVLDGHNFIPPEERFIEELKNVEHVVVVINKKDLGISVVHEELANLFGTRSIFEISAKDGGGIEELCDSLVQEVVGERSSEDESVVITSGRHFKLLKKCMDNLGGASKAISKRESSEFIAHYLRQGLDSLGQITGEITTDDILNEIFSTFCIGK
jgi:tRNA modification GTPase